MLIKVHLIAPLVLAAACASEPLPPTAEVEQGLSCTTFYSCDPTYYWSNWECEEVCGGWQDAGHCLDYEPREIAWCANHPDKFYNPYKWCTPSGNPGWNTWCVKGPVS